METSDKKAPISEEKLLNFCKEFENAPFKDYTNIGNISDINTEIETVVYEEITRIKKSFWQVLGVIFETLIVLSIIACIVYTLIAGSRQNLDNDNFRVKDGNFGVNPTWLADGSSEEANTIYAGLSENGKLQTAYAIYELACKKLSLSKQYAIKGKGNVNTQLAGLSMDIVSNRQEQYYVIGEPSLDANQPMLYSNQDTNYSTAIEGNEFMSSIISAIANNGIRSYCNSEYIYEQKSQSIAKDENNNINVIWQDGYQTLEKGFERSYSEGELREKCNFVINTSTILPETVVINKVDDGGVIRYDISFELDCSDTSEGSATYYEAEAIRRKMGLKRVAYTSLRINMSVYENGYLTNWETVQKWVLAYDLAIIGELEGNATMSKVEAISYDEEECGLVNFLNLP